MPASKTSSKMNKIEGDFPIIIEMAIDDYNISGYAWNLWMIKIKWYYKMNLKNISNTIALIKYKQMTVMNFSHQLRV